MSRELEQLENQLIILSSRIDNILKRGCRSVEDARIIAALTDHPEQYTDYDLQSARHFRRALNVAFDWKG